MATQQRISADPLRVAVYTRVSSEEQVKEHYSLETQREICLRKLDETLGKDLYVPHFFADEGVPGRHGLYDSSNPHKKHRPQLTAMQAAFKAGELDAICVYRMSRLWRKAASGDFLMEQFVPYGLKRVISCTENADISTANGRFQLNITAAVGAFEAEQLGEWVSDALQQRMRDGYPVGWSYGWRKETDGEVRGKRRGIVLVPEEADIIRQMVERYLSGGTLRGVAKWLNTRGVPTPRRAKLWSTSTVKRVMSNPLHAGLVRVRTKDGDAEHIRGHHWDQRIHDPKVLHQILARLERNRTQGPRTIGKPEFLLGGLARCGHCGNRLNGRYSKRLSARLYRCSTGSQAGRAECVRNSERADFIENLVVAELRELGRDPSLQAAARQDVAEVLDDEARGVAEETAALEERLAKLWDNYRYWADRLQEGKCEDDEFELHRQDFREDKEAAEERLAELQSQQSHAETRQAVLQRAQELVADFDASWDGLSMEQKREVVQSIVESATMSHLADGRTEVSFKLRGFGAVTQHIERRSRRDRPDSGPEALTPRQQAMLYHHAQGLDRAAIARKLGVSWGCVNTTLWQARRRIGAETLDQAWALAKDYIGSNLHWLPLTGRRRKVHPETYDAPVLTQAQCKLLSLLADGGSVQTAAGELTISVNTAYVQLKNCRDRLGAGSNEEAIKKAAELGYVA